MPLPSNPTNNQTAVVNGILYTYNSTKGAWTVSTNSEVSYSMSALTTSGLVTAGNVKTTGGVYWANGAPYGGSAGGATTNIQYNSSNQFAGATNFTYTVASGNVVVGTTTATSSTTTGALVVGGGVGVAGNITVGDAINFTGAAPEITFSAANPWINATSYIHFPGGAYFNSGTVYTEAALRARGGIINDTGTKILTIGSASQLSVANTTPSTSTTTGALLVSGGVGVAGQGIFGGNLTVGNMNQTRANLMVFGGNLNAGVGSSVALAEFYTTNTNGSYLRILNNRHAQGADWTSANTRIQQMIDVTPQGYIEFNPVGATFGVAIGTNNTEIIRFHNTTGNVVINGTTASTSTTTGVLVVKGGAGIAGQVTAGNVMTTSGVFWANGAAYSSGSGGGAIATTGIFLNSNVITANATISSGQNGFSVGPMTQSNGVVVTIAPGQRWVIV